MPQQRLTLASDVVRGLVFLHTVCDPPVIHQDIKSDNILLGPAPGVGMGDALVAKLADFGEALRIQPADARRAPRLRFHTVISV